jgi:hypothetical protein
MDKISIILIGFLASHDIIEKKFVNFYFLQENPATIHRKKVFSELPV